MTIETSAARLFHEQFLKIVQQQQKNERPHLQVINKEAQGVHPVTAVAPANNPANWDATWFANYE